MSAPAENAGPSPASTTQRAPLCRAPARNAAVDRGDQVGVERVAALGTVEHDAQHGAVPLRANRRVRHRGARVGGRAGAAIHARPARDVAAQASPASLRRRSASLRFSSALIFLTSFSMARRFTTWFQ